MAVVRVVTDSACDLPDELLVELGVGLVPLRIRFGAEEFIDRVELSTKEFWTRCRSYDGLPETSAPSPGQFQEAYESMVKDGASGIVCVCLSSKMSATIEAARQAAPAAGVPVRVVDSRSITLGEGLVVLEAVDAAAKGAAVDEVAAAAEEAARRVRFFGVIDTLENLKRGGRIGGAQALVGSLLKVKPVIKLEEGVVEEEAKTRTRSKSLQYLADRVREAGAISRLGVMGADAPDLDGFLAMLEGVHPSDKVLIGDIGPVIGTHAGPGAIGVTWLPA
jgi:DegV family protein with EDD domain